MAVETTQPGGEAPMTETEAMAHALAGFRRRLAPLAEDVRDAAILVAELHSLGRGIAIRDGG